MRGTDEPLRREHKAPEGGRGGQININNINIVIGGISINKRSRVFIGLIRDHKTRIGRIKALKVDEKWL
jgi:hypothetical protein